MSGKMDIGTLRDVLVADYHKRLEDVINQNKHRKIYFIIAHTELEAVSGTITTKFMLFNQAPPRMLGCICYMVNNRIGQLRKLWALPQDKPREHIDEGTGMNQDDTERILDSITKLPIIYGG